MRPARAPTALSQLISPLSAAEFFQTYWDQSVLHLTRAEPTYYAEVLTPDELDRHWQSQNLHPAFLKVVRHGVTAPPECWTRLEQRWQTEPYRVVAVEQLFALFNGGSSLVFNAAESALPGVMTFCHRLAGELRAYVQANIYLTPPHSQAVPPHSDEHHLFVLQISGDKEWRLYDRRAEVSLPESAAAGNCSGESGAEREPSQSLTLRPGDLLYVPHGLVHAAKTSETASLHVTLGVHGGYGFQLLEELAGLAQADPFFRQGLPHGLSSGEARSAWLSAFAQRLQELLAATSPGELLQRKQSALMASQPVPRAGRLLDVSGVEQLTLDTQVARRAEVDYQLTLERTNLRLRFARRELTLPLFLAPVLGSLLQGEPLAVGAIGGLLTPSGKLELARQLVRDGLLRMVTT